MITKYRIPTRWTPEIRKFEFLRETDKFLIDAHERRHAKESTDHVYYSTWDSARDALIVLHEQRVVQARRDLELANAKLGNIKGWKNPEAAERVAAQ